MSVSRELPGLLMILMSQYLAFGYVPQQYYGLITSGIVCLWLLTRLLTTPEQGTAVGYCFLILLWLQKSQVLFDNHETNVAIWIAHSFLMMVVHLIGLMLGHELLHQRIHRFWPCLVLCNNGYLVYIWEHIFHHKHAGTENDLSSSKRGTNIYEYLLFRYPIHLKSSFKWFPKAFYVTSTAWLSYIVLVSYLYSNQVAKFLILQTMIHWFWVDAFTYTSHYGVIGLKANDIAWDSHMWSFLIPFFYGIEHHADHHYAPSHLAENLNDRGKLKYPVTLEVALAKAFIPSKWFAMTDPILDNAEKYHK